MHRPRHPEARSTLRAGCRAVEKLARGRPVQGPRDTRTSRLQESRRESPMDAAIPVARQSPDPLHTRQAPTPRPMRKAPGACGSQPPAELARRHQPGSLWADELGMALDRDTTLGGRIENQCGTRLGLEVAQLDAVHV